MSKIYVVGHVNPDTDAIASAMPVSTINSLAGGLGATSRSIGWLPTDGHLLLQREVLESQVDFGDEHGPEKEHARFQYAHFRSLVHRRNRQF